MKKLTVLTILLLVLLFSCSNREAAVKPVDEMDPTTLLIKAEELYNQNQILEARRMYEVIYNNYPTSREYIDAVIGLSRTYNDLGEYEKGMDLLYNLVRENMIPSRVPEIFNEMARYYEVNAGISTVAGLSNEEQDYLKAIEFYRKAINYPNSEDMDAKAHAQYRIGEVYISMLRFKDATLAFEATKQSFPDTRWADTADQRLEEMRLAVNNVLEEMQRGKSTSAPQPAPSPDTLKNVEPAEPAEPPADTTTTSRPVLPEKKPVQQAPTDSVETTPADTAKPAPADTSAKPKLELK